ncbi:MAG: threonylcarbamoyl-AMP synthase [Myxococcales bacterium]|nr:threonylcarbamoyl-AMP synthase [Myxococcales bacterium]
MGTSLDLRTSIEYAVETLKNQGVIIYPTETVYGIGADGLNQALHRRIGQLKGRPSDKPYLLLVDSVQDAESLVGPMPEIAYQLAEQFWPGPLTMILPLVGKPRTLGLRVSSHPVVRQLLRSFGRPLISTSANLTGDPPPREISEVARKLRDQVDWVIDAGPTPGDRPSTIVDVSGIVPTVRRDGPITRTELAIFGVR